MTWVLLDKEVYEEFFVTEDVPFPDGWVPWEEAWRSNEDTSHSNYRCSICHFDTGDSWTLECPNASAIEHAVTMALRGQI